MNCKGYEKIILGYLYGDKKSLSIGDNPKITGCKGGETSREQKTRMVKIKADHD